MGVFVNFGKTGLKWNKNCLWVILELISKMWVFLVLSLFVFWFFSLRCERGLLSVERGERGEAKVKGCL